MIKFRKKRLFIGLAALLVSAAVWLLPVWSKPQMKAPAEGLSAWIDECAGVDSAAAQSSCSTVCKRVCEEKGTCWVYGGIKNGMNYYKQKSCCVAWGNSCAQVCTGPLYSPPSVNASLNCAQDGNNGWCVGTLSLEITTSDPQAFDVSIVVEDPDAVCNGACTLSLPNGTGNAGYTATASTSLLTDTGSVVWKRDPDSPVITRDIAGDAGSNGWYVSAVTLSSSAEDILSGLDLFDLHVNGAAAASPVMLTEGLHDIAITARDTAGNVSAESFTLNIDRTAPVMNISRDGNLGNAGWYRSAVDFQISASDATSGPQVGEYRIDGGLWQVGMSFTVSGDGTHALEYRVFDNAGNFSARSEVVKIDTSMPTVDFLTPSENTPVDKIVHISGTAADLGAGLDSVEVSVNGGASWIPVSIGDWTYDWNVARISNGVQTALVRARDSAGNLSSASSLDLLVDTSGPRISVADPWTFDLAGDLKIMPNAYDVKTVSFVIVNSAGEVMNQYTGSEIPPIIWWDGKHAGAQQPAGEYPVVVTACDVYGVCSTARSAIHIPIFDYIPNSDPPAIPQVIVPAPPIIVPAPVSVDVLESPQILGITFSSAKRSGAALLFIFVLLFLGSVMFDPRPRAMRSLARTIRKNIKESQ